MGKRINKFRGGALVISLDFELLWGVFDVLDPVVHKDYFLNTRLVIPEVLELFKFNKIHATWATVGMLFNQNWEEWNFNKPEVLPLYRNTNLSSYEYGDKIQTKGFEDLCFAPGLIELIRNVPNQEIGSHTYSHYYCLEPGQDIMAFSKDLDMWVRMANKKGITLNSLVFPRNQLNQEHIDVCIRKKITSIRSNPASWYWADPTSESLLVKLTRTGDAYFNFGKKSYPWNVLKKEGSLLHQPASRFLRPVENNSFLRTRKLNRILAEMTTAAKQNEIYHLWWHPHNFGDQPQESIKDLKTLIDHFIILKNEYNFQSLNMAEVEEYS